MALIMSMTMKSLPSNLMTRTALIASMLLSGCTPLVHTAYHQPAVSLPSQFQTQSKGQPANQIRVDQVKDQWWTLFQDPELNHLVDMALARNNDLAVAGIRLKQAREKVGLANDAQGLRVNSNSSASHDIQLKNSNTNSSSFSVNAGVSYTLDLWGKLANQTDAAKWEAAATAQDLQNTAQTLIANVCNYYWQIGYLNQRIAASEASVASSKKLYQLVQVQYKAGEVSGLELAQAEQSVVGQEATYSQLVQQRFQARTALSILFDQASIPDFKEPQNLNSYHLPDIQAGLPADILSRRPDLQAAELRLRESLANSDATRASYYPSISLTGSLGSSSTSLVDVLKNPVLALGAGLSLPFLQFNDMKRNIAVSQMDYEAAVINYRKTLYTALGDVNNALSAQQQLAIQADAQQRTLELAQKAEKLNEIRYRAGAVALNQWITAQDSRRDTENSLIQIRENQLTNMVTLLQSLGGSPLSKAP